ncbi:MAG TPA: DUF4920 domain-containing protein [Flavobacteriaceae bacterium]|nr:DUF4920 domain-containing protein [Flavobacteriaceae bacterium]MCB9213659.1 DUF4920 domain-containing protein [Alteromonas sp.]HPF12160.1 DUF4920 domain-containing protein [Flavobacteriaceae bacterium]HQU22293.1 DUF4920 domain-containing protein [Flavobacteriaceae bacterium]HQU65989.1 DUF4920 domain-containing protein [Flavobacteriaceae bacterium]
MKNLSYLFVFAVLLVACKNTTESTDVTAEATPDEMQAPQYQSFGDKIDDANVITMDEMKAKYASMHLGDTVDVKFTSKVNSVCQAKGCWMRLDLGEAESFVKFKDYAFFMPKDIAGQEVIVEGKAYVEETSVEDLKHFAKDAGKTQEEIDAITEPEKTFAFLSSGVLIPEKQ